jgi:hypothetical protein
MSYNKTSLYPERPSEYEKFRKRCANTEQSMKNELVIDALIIGLILMILPALSTILTWLGKFLLWFVKFLWKCSVMLVKYYTKLMTWLYRPFNKRLSIIGYISLLLFNINLIVIWPMCLVYKEIYKVYGGYNLNQFFGYGAKGYYLVGSVIIHFICLAIWVYTLNENCFEQCSAQSEDQSGQK